MSFARAVWARLTWPRILIAEAMGFGVALLQWLDWRDQKLQPPTSWVIGHFTQWALAAFFILYAALWADEAAKRGARPLAVYPPAHVAALVMTLLTAALIGGIHLSHGHIAFHGPEAGPVPLSLVYGQFAIDFILYGGLPVLYHANRETTLRMLERLHELEATRTKLEAHLLEVRLAAAEAEMDPAMLLAALAEIKRDIERSAPETDEKLENLIRRLRMNLARTLVAGAPEALER
ncbi:MAG: hypothetical protein ACRD3Q_03345 [Terriglobales bacterium]